MVKREQQTTPTTGRDALTDYYNSTRGLVRQSKRYRTGQILAPLALSIAVIMGANALIGNDGEPTGPSAGDRAASAPQSYPTEGAQPETGASSGAPMDGGAELDCDLGGQYPLPYDGSGRRGVALDIKLTGADLGDKGTTLQVPLVQEGTITPGMDATATHLPDGTFAVEVPAASTESDVYAVYVNALGQQALCGGFYMDAGNPRTAVGTLPPTY